MSIPKAISLLYRWLAHDVPDGSDDAGDLTLDDETNDLLIAYSMPRAEQEQAVLDASAQLDLREDASGNVTCYGGTRALELAEWARRKARAEADAIHRGLTAAGPEIRERARTAWRRLESLR